MNWKSFLKEDPTEWLLEEENPSVRYLTLTTILDRSESDPEVTRAREAIMQSYPVTAILSHQTDGYWVSLEHPFRPKYRGTYHQLLILSELGAKASKEIEKTIEIVFREYQYESGHFSGEIIKTERGRKSSLTDGACLTGNIVRALIHFGFLHHESTQKAISFLVKTHRRGWFCRVYPIERGRVFPECCYMGGVKPLLHISLFQPQNLLYPTYIRCHLHIL